MDSLQSVNINLPQFTSAAPALEEGYFPGKLTWGLEGSERRDSPYYSRKVHLPLNRGDKSNKSGVTIGRGYDLSKRKKEEVIADFLMIGWRLKDARQLAEGVGLTGEKAKRFIQQNNLPELTQSQEKNLFIIDYNRYVEDVKRIISKKDVVNTYGPTDWKGLHPGIREVLVDLRYRGDYTSHTRKFLQRAVSRNDFNEFRRILNKRELWLNVTESRFMGRVKFLNSFSSR